MQLRNTGRWLCGLLTVLPVFPTLSLAEDSDLRAATELNIQTSLNKYCADCHNEERQKGKIRLDNFSTLDDQAKFDLLGMVEEQLYLEEMPPEDEDLLPTAACDPLRSSNRWFMVVQRFDWKKRQMRQGMLLCCNL